MRSLAVISLIITMLLFSFCGNKPKKDLTIQPEQFKNDLEKVNKTLVQKENEDIEDYIARHEWKMKSTGTGLRYNIYYKGKGASPKSNNKVVIRFVVNLINGIECYNSKTDGLKQIELGKAEVESGLEEGIMLMKVGDKAKLIIPSHLAFGLLGDENKIPKRATLIYDVELIEIK
ncbi:MAG: FKBP-type peptidyl-prolyl cis-trans isomerase [Bacteroidota bacterium]